MKTMWMIKVPSWCLPGWFVHTLPPSIVNPKSLLIPKIRNELPFLLIFVETSGSRFNHHVSPFCSLWIHQLNRHPPMVRISSDQGASAEICPGTTSAALYLGRFPEIPLGSPEDFWKKKSRFFMWKSARNGGCFEPTELIYWFPMENLEIFRYF